MLKKILYIILFFNTNLINAQFYNGLQNQFGKNRIQYKSFDWQFMRFEKFDVYYYTNGAELAKYVAQSTIQNLNNIEKILDFTLEDRIEIVVYNKHNDFIQTNIGLSSTENNIGGNAKLVGSKIIIYYDDDHSSIDKQIRSGIAEVLLNQWLFGGNWRDKVKNSAVLNLPEWYTKGLIKYISEGWNNEVDNKTKDAILSGKFKKFNNLDNDNAIIAGHSIWNYIVESYGKEVIPNLIYMSQVSRNIESGLNFVLGSTLDIFISDWQKYYLSKYNNEDIGKVLNYNTKIKGIKKFRQNEILTDFKISPDGKQYAYSTNESGKFKVFIYDVEKKRTSKIYSGGLKLERENDKSFPVIAWHPKSQRLAFIIEEKGEVVLNYYMLDSKELERRPPLFYFEKVLQLQYTPDGKRFLMSAVKNGQTDIFNFNIISNKIENITNDIYDDIDPCILMNGKKVIFSSNRNNDSMYLKPPNNIDFSNNNYDLYLFDLESKTKELIRLTETPNESETSVHSTDTANFTYLTSKFYHIDKMSAKVDSLVLFVDTIEHYRYYIKSYKITNYSRAIWGYSSSPSTNQTVDWYYINGKIVLNLNQSKKNNEVYAPITNPQINPNNKLLVDIQKFDYLSNYPQINTIKLAVYESVDDGKLDYQKYVFEEEKESQKSNQKPIKLDIPIDSINSQTEKFRNHPLPNNFTGQIKRFNYLKYFTIDQIVSQFNNNFSNNSYQKFTGSASYFNPSLNGLVKIGLSDLFEDYRIVGGFRLSSDLKSNEFLLSYEDRHKRWDKQLLLYRQSISYNGSIVSPKVLTHNLTYSLRYPFNEVLSWRSSFTGRVDRSTYAAFDDVTLQKKSSFDYWMSGKSELIYDNTRQRMINILNGSRAKFFVEYFNRINYLKNNLGVVGVDVRHYQKIYKNFIWASRFAASTSFGNSKLVYYLGGVDNWWNFGKNPTFNDSIPISNSSTYSFQAIATNMRGFSQNIRNGNNFAILNNEIRLPIINYLYNRPIRSDFFNNIQVVAFYDIGSAWIGKSPFSKVDEYTSDIIPTPKNGPISVTLINNRHPIVYGYGWGLRSRLFGYFVRADWAWGIADKERNPRIFYLSLSTDF